MRGPNVVYVGNLPSDIKEREIQELFDKVRGRQRQQQQMVWLWALCVLSLTLPPVCLMNSSDPSAPSTSRSHPGPLPLPLWSLMTPGGWAWGPAGLLLVLC